jgi:hypothetical protein
MVSCLVGGTEASSLIRCVSTLGTNFKQKEMYTDG